MAQAQGVHHEFKRHILRRHGRAAAQFVRRVLCSGEVARRVLRTGFAHDAAGKREFAVRTRADAQIVAKAPVVEIVAAFFTGAGEGGGFVVCKTGVPKMRGEGVADVSARIVVGQGGGGLVREGGVRFNGELVAGKMRDACCQRGCYVCQRGGDGLAGQGVYQVDIAAREGLLRQRQCGARLRAVVNAPDAGKRGVVKTLHAQRETIDAGIAKGTKTRRFHRAGVGFQGDFHVRCQPEFVISGVQQAGDVGGVKQTGRAAAEKHGLDAPPAQFFGGQMQIGQQRGEIARLHVLRQVCAVQRVGVEIAIRAFAHAPGQVHVERKRGRHAGAGQITGRVRSRRCTMSVSASERWLRTFLMAGSSSAAVCCSSGR